MYKLCPEVNIAGDELFQMNILHSNLGQQTLGVGQSLLVELVSCSVDATTTSSNE